MTSRCRTIRSSAVPVARDGATLTEVLISILVMSVGVLSVMAMFPISILRSIQATQLTNAAILRENVRQQIAIFPEVVLGAPSGHPIRRTQRMTSSSRERSPATASPPPTGCFGRPGGARPASSSQSGPPWGP